VAPEEKKEKKVATTTVDIEISTECTFNVIIKSDKKIN
jgi:hypothetical protein